MTTFTINSGIVPSLQQKLNEIGATPIRSMKSIKNGIDTGRSIGIYSDTFGGNTLKMDLPSGTKFMTTKTLSKNQLRKLLGSKAMVRGVNK
jgi:hypothetical protein